MQQDWPSGTGVSSPKDREKESNRREEGSNRREKRREKRMVFECQASEGSQSDAQQALQQTQKTNSQREDPLVFLYSSDSEEGEDVRRVRVSDEGS